MFYFFSQSPENCPPFVITTVGNEITFKSAALILERVQRIEKDPNLSI